MHKILVMCLSDPESDPRPNRIINTLKDQHMVAVTGRGKGRFNNVSFIPLPVPKKKGIVEKLKLAFELIIGQFERFLWQSDIKRLANELVQHDYELIICHDLHLLPLACSIKRNAKILCDAREYYPRHFEDQLIWQFLFKNLNHYLCRTYLHQCDQIITVSEGISKEYEKEYGVRSDVLMSLPKPYHIRPSDINKDCIKIIYHGNANPSRKTDSMVRMMGFTDRRYVLDLMLMPNDLSYLSKLKKLANRYRNVNVIEPVAFKDIVPFTNAYDIGLFLAPPTTFNLKHALPNKLFEYIQARLAVAIGPSVEMKKIVNHYDCGIISEDFKPQSLAKKLNGISYEELQNYKKRSDIAAKVLNTDVSEEIVNNKIAEMIGQ